MDPNTTFPWLLYGANGYTGSLIAKEAAKRGLRPILAGRSKGAVESLAAELEMPCRVFSLDDPAQIAEHLTGCVATLNCAGPFARTAAPLMKACLTAGTSYIDITGEIDCIEAAAALGRQAEEQGVSLLPAMGFDVVPTDCLAAMTAAKVDHPTKLQLAFGGLKRVSGGTLKTVLQSLPQGGRSRVDGVIQHTAVAEKTRQIPFANGTKWAMTIPWGDVSSAFYSTGIPNIEVYAATPRWQAKSLRRLGFLRHVARPDAVQKTIDKLVSRAVKGPTSSEREAGRAQIWARVENEQGDGCEMTMATPEGYSLTVQTALAGVERFRESAPRVGFATPSMAFGADFILEFEGVELNPQ